MKEVFTSDQRYGQCDLFNHTLAWIDLHVPLQFPHRDSQDPAVVFWHLTGL